MRFLKGLALGLAGFILLISLLILGLAVSVNPTLLNPGFMKYEIKQIDIQSIVQESLKDTLSPEIQPYLDNVGVLISGIKPWIYQQTDYLIDSTYRYLQGRSAELNLVVDTQEIKPIVIKWITETYLSALPADQLKTIDTNQLSNEIKQEVEQVLPPALEINAETLGSESMIVLGEIKKAIAIWQISFYLICVIFVLLIAAIVMLSRNIKEILRALGIIFLIPGVIGIPLYFVLINLPKNMPLEGVPESLISWISQVLKAILTPFGIYSAALLIAGVAMVLASFIFFSKSIKESSPAPNVPAAT